MIDIAEATVEAAVEGNKMSKKMVLIISALLWISSILFLGLSPGALKSAVHEATTEVIIQELEPIHKNLEENSVRLECIEEIQNSQVLDGGIAAYKKFESVAEKDLPKKLESSTQNAAAIRIALRVESAKDVLYQIDPDRTKYFLEYLDIK